MTNEDVLNTLKLLYSDVKIISDDVIAFKNDNQIGWYYIPNGKQESFDVESVIIRPTYSMHIEKYIKKNAESNKESLKCIIYIFKLGQYMRINCGDGVSKIKEFPEHDYKIVTSDGDVAKRIYFIETGKHEDIFGNNIRISRIKEPIPIAYSIGNEVRAMDIDGNKGTIQEILELQGIKFKEIKHGRVLNFEIEFNGTKQILNNYGQLY